MVIDPYRKVQVRTSRVAGRSFEGDETAAEELARRAADAMDPALTPQHREMALQLVGRKHGKKPSQG